MVKRISYPLEVKEAAIRMKLEVEAETFIELVHSFKDKVSITWLGFLF